LIPIFLTKVKHECLLILTECGTNENHNRVIRRLFPKGTTKTTSDEVAQIENWMNHYPRKKFKYQTPIQILQGD